MFIKYLKNYLWKNNLNFAIGLSQDISDALLIEDYYLFLKKIQNISHFKNVSLLDLLNKKNEDYCFFSIRHDIDIDPITALKLARIESKLNFKSSFYILHTAPFYKFFKNNSFIPSEKILKILKLIENLGHEVGLHNDSLNELISKNLDPKKNIQNEINHLVNFGIHIKSISHHSSVYKYNAGNYELFKNQSINKRVKFEDFNANTHKLGYLTLSEFNLIKDVEYFSDLFFYNPENIDLKQSDLYKFFSSKDKKFFKLVKKKKIEKKSRLYDFHISLYGKDKWIIDDCNFSSKFIDRTKFVAQDYLLNFLRSNKTLNKRLVLDIHPIYYGYSMTRFLLNKFKNIIGV